MKISTETTRTEMRRGETLCQCTSATSKAGVGEFIGAIVADRSPQTNDMPASRTGSGPGGSRSSGVPVVLILRRHPATPLGDQSGGDQHSGSQQCRYRRPCLLARVRRVQPGQGEAELCGEEAHVQGAGHRTGLREGQGAGCSDRIELLTVAQVTPDAQAQERSEEHTSELQSRGHLVCRLLLEKKKRKNRKDTRPIHRSLYDQVNKRRCSCLHREYLRGTADRQAMQVAQVSFKY